MPVYNVERYISDTLDTLVVQENNKLKIQIIIIDDGSTDLTKSIIKTYQRKYGFIELIEKNQIGPGAARNIAIRKAKSDYITFIDGDDLLYPNVYQKLIDSSEKNDADIVVGNVSRFNSTKSFFLSGLHKKIFSTEMEGTHIVEYSNLLYDTTSWNKLFKTRFLQENNILFPEGILYEDIPFNMEAHLKSKRTNIILDFIYKWQLRDDVNQSITQSRFNKKNMLDRVEAIRLFNTIVNDFEITEKIFLEQKEYKELTLDFKLFLDQLDQVDEDYFDSFSDAVTAYMNNMKTDVFVNKIPTSLKIKYKLLMNKKREELLDFIAHTRQFEELKTTQIDDKVYKDFEGTMFEGYLTKADVDMFSDIIPITKVQNISWKEDTLNIKGFAYLKYLNTNKDTKIKAFLTDESGKSEIELPTVVKKDKNITQMYGGGKQEHLLRRYVNYDYSIFETKVKILDERIKTLLKEDCFIRLVIENGNHKGEIPVSSPVKGLKVRPRDKSLNNVIYKISYDKQWKMRIISNELAGTLTKVDLIGDTFVFEGSTISKKYPQAILKNYTSNYSKILPVEYRDNHSFSVTVKIDFLLLLSERENFYLYLLSEEGEEVKIEVSDQIYSKYAEYNCYDIYFEKTRNKILKISRENDVFPKVQNISVNEKTSTNYSINLIVQQSISNKIEQATLEMVRNSDGNILSFNPEDIIVRGESVMVSYSIPITKENLFNFGNSSWKFYQTIHTSDESKRQNVIYLDAVKKEHWHIYKNNFELSKNKYHSLQLVTSLKKSYFDKGPRRLKLLKEYLYPLMKKLPQKKNYVMFESYWGRSYSCNPKAIYEQMLKDYPNLVGIWSFNNPYTQIKGKGKVVKRNSWQYFYYLARAKYFINNVNWPTEYEKRKGSVEVQTLHGTFLKTMGLDVEAEVNTPQKLEGFRKRHKRWDYLVSPSQFMTEISKRVFEFEGEMLEYGFPRNDVLVNSSVEKSASQQSIREYLNIPKDKKIILYAPTYRNKSGFNFELDIAKMHEKLSDEYVLLIRLHYFVSRNLDLSNFGDFVVNVCNYPDVQELLLVTDVLITDYSSIMFDYANLKKPMMFFTYDLEYYRDVLRGMYLDFEKEAPGKLCSTTEELIESLGNLSSYEQRYQKKLMEFSNKFNQLETGQASSQILKKIIRESEKRK